jgi:hypothetical protein
MRQWREKLQRPKRENNHDLKYLDAGWGGRIRTSEWRNQNPLPYHLATPQKVELPSTGEPLGARNIAVSP